MVDLGTNTGVATVSATASGFAVGADATPFAIQVSGGWVWVRYKTSGPVGCASGPDCRQSVARIDAATNTVVAVADLPPGFGGFGITVGPSTVWITADGMLARIDF